MATLAALLKSRGHDVRGSDQNVYPPMSTQLTALGIELHEGYDAEQLAVRPDLLLVGNVMTRGMPVIEAMLDRGSVRISQSNFHFDNPNRYRRPRRQRYLDPSVDHA